MSKSFILNKICFLGRECCAAGIQTFMTTGRCSDNELTGECRTNFFSCCRCCQTGTIVKPLGITRCRQAADDADCDDILLGCCRNDFGKLIYKLLLIKIDDLSFSFSDKHKAKW